MIQELRIHRIKSSGKIYTVAVVVALLLPIVLTLTIPRETFDPHLGVDYDTYCRLYYGINAQDEIGVSLTIIPIQIIIAIASERRAIVISSPLLETHIIRAPPVTIV